VAQWYKPLRYRRVTYLADYHDAMMIHHLESYPPGINVYIRV
jgi:hypothetical protein